jgi:hypothetical protein
LQQVGGIVKLQFELDMRPIGLYRFDAEVQHFGYFAGSVPLAYQSENLQFPIAQAADRRRPGFLSAAEE